MKSKLFPVLIAVMVSAILGFALNSEKAEMPKCKTFPNLINITNASFYRTIDGIEDGRYYYVRAPLGGSPLVAALAQAIYLVEGVKRITPDAYEFFVAKSPCYTWGEVQPKIVALIKEFEKLSADGVSADETKEEEKKGT